MGLTGRYDFKGIQKLSVAAIDAAIAGTTWGASAVFKFFQPAVDVLLNMLINWLANKGLIVLNLGAVFVNNELDQAAFDKALSDAWEKIEQGRDKLSPEQGAALDDAVRKAASRFIDFGAANNGVPDVQDSGFQGGSDASIQ